MKAATFARARRWIMLCAGAALVFATIATCEAAADFSATAEREGSAVRVELQATVSASVDTVWRTLTDYDRLWEFIPGLTQSRVVGREGPTAIVEETGAAKFWFLSYPMNVVLASTERPPDAIDVRVVSGNLKRLDGSYRIDRTPEGAVRLSWSGLVEPDFWIPPFIGVALVRSRIAEQFKGMVQEIERRASASR